MFVINRLDKREDIDIEKIRYRIDYLTNRHPKLNTDTDLLTENIINKITNGIKTSDIDEHSADIAVSMSINNYDYFILSGRILIDNLHKKTIKGFWNKIRVFYDNKSINGERNPLIREDFYNFVKHNNMELDKMIDYSRDFDIDYIGMRVLEKGKYLIRSGDVIETPQDLFMRVSIEVQYNKYNDNDINTVLTNIKKMYDNMSNKYYIHATPTLFNSGTTNHQLSSCFLVKMGDSLEGIMGTAETCAKISKYAGGIGIHCHELRANNSVIRGTNGNSNDITTTLKIFNATARKFNQGGKRKGSFAVFIELHHADILKMLDIRKTIGDENERCRDLYYAVWISDLFMNRVKNNEEWSVFCPNECPNLNTTWGSEYEKLYLKYELEGKQRATYKAREVWRKIFDSHVESSLPYMLYKDNVNKSNMQSNLGTIQSSNLCCEILIYSDDNEIGVCNLASICLPQFVRDSHSAEELSLPVNERRELNDRFPTNPYFDFEKLVEISGELTENLNKVIDKNFNINEKTIRSNFNHRPIGIGVQGLADVYYKCKIPFDSEQARVLNKQIFEGIYYGALTASSKMCRTEYKKVCDNIKELGSFTHSLYPMNVLNDLHDICKNNLITKLSYGNNLTKEQETHINNITIDTLVKEACIKEYSKIDDVPKSIGSYFSYNNINDGSPMKNGKFHWELCGLTENNLSGRYDWDTLRQHIDIYGVKNSLLCALMPTVSTSQILGFSSCFEPYISNIFNRNTLHGRFPIINKYLMKELNDLELWDDDMAQYLMQHDGSVQNIEGIPQYIKDQYKTAFEIKQSAIIDQAAERQPFIDQSQSMNLFIADYTFDKFHKAQFYGWQKGIKTGIYYLRTREASSTQKFTIKPTKQKEIIHKSILNLEVQADDEICAMCSS